MSHRLSILVAAAALACFASGCTTAIDDRQLSARVAGIERAGGSSGSPATTG